MSSTVAGKVVVVTGAARGIGAALAEKLAAAGAVVALLGLEAVELEAVTSRCPGAAWWEVDVTDEPGLRRVAAEIVDRFGSVDVVVANAGIASGGPVSEAAPEVFDRVIEVNLLGSVRTARAFLPYLIEFKGYYLQVASLAAIMPAPLMAAYCASKSGVEAFAHSLAAEIKYKGVDVGVTYLSWTDTDMLRGGDSSGLEHMRKRFLFPFNRTYPVGPLIDRMVSGIGRRKAHIYGQSWLPGAILTRGTMPQATMLIGRRDVPSAEKAMIASGATARAMGAGGDADAVARKARG